MVITMGKAIIAIIGLHCIYRVIMGEWIDPTDPDYQAAIQETFHRLTP